MSEEQHTPEGLRYREFHEYAEQMNQDDWRQVKCPEHDRYCLWVRADAST